MIIGGYSKEDVQTKLDMIYAMVENYAKEREEKEAAMLVEFEEKLTAMKAEFEDKKQASDVLIIELNKDIVALNEDKEAMEQEQDRIRKENDELTAENKVLVQEQYRLKETYKAYYGGILKKYSDSLTALSGEFEDMLKKVSNMQKSISEDSMIEGLDNALEVLGENLV